MMHGFTGAAAGAALGKSAKEGAISGAIAAVAATTVANFIKEDPNIIGERAVAKAKAEGSPLDKASLQPYIRAELRGMIDISRLSGAIATLFAGYDVTIGIDVATTAVINNCAQALTNEVFKAIGGLVATTIAGGLLAKKQTEDHLNGTSKREMAPEDVDWKDQGVPTEDGKPNNANSGLEMRVYKG